MFSPDFLYDVAFSFLAQDEALAVKLNDDLQKTCSTFLYSERQKEIAGTDGEATFTKVYGTQARCVVILFRPDWGQTKWTRHEETAIRNRAHDEGYDFALFVPLQDPPSVPKWVPATRLWIGLDRWGVTAAAAVIENRVRELGGAPKVETLEDRAARQARELTFESERKAALMSDAGVQAFRREFAALASAVGAAVSRVNASQQVTRARK